MPEQFWSPAGQFIVLRPDAGGEAFWIVRVLNFASWRHSTKQFPTEAAARAHADLWRI